MSTPRARTARSLAVPHHPTRQQLDDLDALLQRMLALPVDPSEEALTAEEAPHAEEARYEMAARPTLLPIRPPQAPAAPALPPTPAPPAASAPLTDVPAWEAPADRSWADRSYPPSYMVVETVGPGFSSNEAAPEPPSHAALPPQPAEPELRAAEEAPPAAEEEWVPLRSSWQPSPHTWGPLADTWQQARHPSPSSAVPALPSGLSPDARLDLAAPRSSAPALPEPAQAPARPIFFDPPPSAPIAQLPPAPLPTTPAPAPAPEMAPVPWPLRPVLAFNIVFDAFLIPWGYPGRWFRGRSGRNLLGVVGVLCLMATAALATADWFGWTW